MPTYRIALTIGCLLLACAPTVARPQSAAEWQALQLAAETKSDDIMAGANTHKGLLDQYEVMRQAYGRDTSVGIKAFSAIIPMRWTAIRLGSRRWKAIAHRH
jgi:hypothetical protein